MSHYDWDLPPPPPFPRVISSTYKWEGAFVCYNYVFTNPNNAYHNNDITKLTITISLLLSQIEAMLFWLIKISQIYRRLI